MNYSKLKSGLILYSFPVILGAFSLVYPSEYAPAVEVSTSSPQINDPNLFVNLSQKVIPSVVNIAVESSVQNRSEGSPADLFKKHFEDFYGFGSPQSPFNRRRIPKQSALGSGVIVDVKKTESLILTNYHVVEGATKIKIQFSNGSEIKEPITGRVVGKDPDLDLALIKVKAGTNKGMKALSFGDSDQLRVGEYVMAVGNPFGQGHSVSHGIVSAKDRSAPIIGKYLQTDAPINPGNSGGPLVNLKGEIIGINNAILARAQGIGFAIPANSIKNVLAQLKDQGFVERGYLGILMGQVTPEAAAFSGDNIKVGQAFVVDVEPDSPAAKAGLKQNDVILKFDGKAVKTPNDLRLVVAEKSIDSKSEVQVFRNGKIKNIQVKLGKRKV